MLVIFVNVEVWFAERKRQCEFSYELYVKKSIFIIFYWNSSWFWSYSRKTKNLFVAIITESDAASICSGRPDSNCLWSESSPICYLQWFPQWDRLLLLDRDSHFDLSRMHSEHSLRFAYENSFPVLFYNLVVVVYLITKFNQSTDSDMNRHKPRFKPI